MSWAENNRPVAPTEPPANIDLLANFYAKPKYGVREKYKGKDRSDCHGRTTVFKSLLPYSPRTMNDKPVEVVDYLARPTENASKIFRSKYMKEDKIINQNFTLQSTHFVVSYCLYRMKISLCSFAVHSTILVFIYHIDPQWKKKI
jgi:hypothetical protein